MPRKKINRPKDICTLIGGYLGNKYRYDLYDSSFKFSSEYIDIEEITSNSTIYFDMIRRFAYIFKVRILRNEHDIKQGIYVVGREPIAKACAKYLVKIITQIEDNTHNYQLANVLHAMDLNGKKQDQYISDRRLQFLNYFSRYIDQNFNSAMVMRDNYGADEYNRICIKVVMMEVNLNEYIESISTLRILKPFLWRTIGSKT